jgi:diguanylate cyclase (GGDEF)-like protein
MASLGQKLLADLRDLLARLSSIAGDRCNRSSQLSVIAFLKREARPLALLGGVFALLTWQRFGMESERVLTPGAPDLRAVGRDDNLDGGKSVCTAGLEDGVWRIHYDIRAGVSWAFCGIGLLVKPDRDGRGLDLSGYDDMVVELARTTGPNRSFQATFKSMDPAVYSPGDETSLKTHTIVFAPAGRQGYHAVLPFDYFQVPPWWVARYQVPVEHLNRDRRDVRELELLTSTDKVELGSGTVDIRRILLRGKWVRQAVLVYGALAGTLAWVFGALVVRALRSVRIERELRLREVQLRDLASRDPLTGILNRLGFDLALRDMLLRSRQEKEQTIGVLVIDLDLFKQVNDRLGHQAGDVVLRDTTRAIQTVLRPCDLLARWGGEEFLVAIINIPPARLVVVAEDIRAGIAAGVRFGNEAVTASVGVAVGPSDQFLSLVGRADVALYEAKGAGRNRVAVAN